MKGEIFYEQRDFKNALKEFSFDTIKSYNLARVATYIKLRNNKKAKENIKLLTNFEDKSFHGIYFEIRHFSEPADPKKWMKGTHL